MIKETMKIFDRMAIRVSRRIISEIGFDSNVLIVLRNEEGTIKQMQAVHNTVTAVGLAAIVDQLLASPSEAKPGWMEVGTGTPSATKLGAYVADSRTALSEKTRDGAVVTFKCTFAAGVGTGALTEAGLFNVDTQDSGTMYLSASFGTMTKGAADSIEIVWTLTASTV